MSIPILSTRLWSGGRGTRAQLQGRIRAAFGMAPGADSALVTDRDGRPVRVDMARLMHVAFARRDPSRWRLIPLIRPTIEQGVPRRHARRIAYEASFGAVDAQGQPSRGSFVAGVIEASGERVFLSIVGPSGARRIAHEQGKAGPEEARPNPPPAYMGTRNPRRQDRAARRLPGAAPALRTNGKRRVPGNATTAGRHWPLVAVTLASALLLRRLDQALVRGAAA